MRRKRIKRRKNRYLLLLLFLVLFAAALYFYLQRGQHISKIITRVIHPAKPFVVKPISKTSLLILENYFDSQNAHGVFNGSFLIGRNDSIYLQKSYGYANYRRKTTNTATTAFQLASVSKQFTAVSILILKERKLLKLSDPVQKYFPDFPYPGITIELLLTHRSGLPNYIYFGDEYIKDKQSPVTNTYILELMKQFRPPVYFPPGRSFVYSNTGYAVLAAIVEKVSHRPFPEFVRREIFGPLGMKNSGFTSLIPTDSINRATGYNHGWNEAAFTFLDGVFGDKGIYATPGDLFRWDQGLYKSKIVSSESLEDAFQPRAKKAGSKKNYGFGWRMMTLDDNARVLYHTGWWEGFQSLLVRIPWDHTTIVVLKNRKAGIIDKAAILKILYPGSFKVVNPDREVQMEEEQEGG